MRDRRLIDASRRLVLNEDFVRVMRHLANEAAMVLVSTDPHNVASLQDAALAHAMLYGVFDRVQELSTTTPESD